MRLIIVDDDLQTVEVIRDSINWKMFGISDVEVAYNVLGAKKLFQEKVPDIVLCDIEMPKASGLDLLKWVRENGYKSEFIFLTCHESFEFASIALNYNAISYITKPFNIDKTEMAISKAIEKIAKENYYEEYSEYGKYWVENKRLVLQSFWRELLFFSIPSENPIILEEIAKRKLSLNVNDSFNLVLVSVAKSENEERRLDDQSFEYALKKLSSEIILGELQFDNTIYYVTNRNHYVAIITKDQSVENLKNNCLDFIENCQRYLKCTTTCYIGNKTTMASLGQLRVELEEMDQANIVFIGNVFLQGDERLFSSNEKYIIDTEILGNLLEKGEKIQIVNILKGEIERLANEGKLDTTILNSIHQDFMQVLYSFLYKKEIQAHKLFSDKVSQKLQLNADNSVFDMLKWVNFVTAKTIDYVKEVEKSETVIDKSKKYIQEHYKEEISRNDVAAIVFITPDYLGKMFKSETGMSIKDYINMYRIEKAKELLKSSSASISMIAAEVGFDNFSYFSTIFKKSTGMGPQSFRKDTEK